VICAGSSTGFRLKRTTFPLSALLAPFSAHLTFRHALGMCLLARGQRLEIERRLVIRFRVSDFHHVAAYQASADCHDGCSQERWARDASLNQLSLLIGVKASD